MAATGLLTLILLPAVSAQLSIFNLIQCGNLNSGVCRLQCLSNEISVYPATCTFYTAIYGLYFQRCVTSMPCCYWAGTCQTSCSSNQTQLTTGATCTNSGDVCCISTTGVNPSATTTTPTTTTIATVANSQGVCGSLTRRVLGPRIIGGTQAQPGSWPWMVRVSYTTTPGYCAGVLVDADTVLTAAHCIAGIPAGSMQVTVGEYDVSRVDQDEEVVNVREYWLASGFLRGRRGNDFAVLKLSRNVTFTTRKLPVCLADPTIPLVSPRQCYIAGWGGSESSIGGVLREADVTLLDRATCEQRLRNLGVFVTLPSDMVCTDNPATAQTDGCLFDDGDMLVCRDTQNRWSLVGLMSEYSCGSALPVLYTDVRVYTDVILNRL